MNNPVCRSPLRLAVCSIQRCDRWSIHHRLQELDIACDCPADGSLHVEVNHATDLLLAHSTVRQFITPRQEQIDWLNRCWHTHQLCPRDR